MANKKLTTIAILSTLCLVLSYIESLFPLLVSFPGVKLGLGNLAVLFALYRLDKKSAFLISIIKIFASVILFKGFSSLIFALSGGMLSFFVMAIFKSNKSLSIFGVSMLGGISHNIGQILASFIVLKSTVAIVYLPILLVSGVLSGLFIGWILTLLLKHIK